MIKTLAYGATHFHKSLNLKKFERQSGGPSDVELELLYCGVCHSDVHQVNNDWLNTVWPCVPGHEIVGKVTKVGSSVTQFKVGDIAAIGCMVDSCGACYSCTNGQEQYCEGETGCLATYNGPMNPTGQNTYGGYSSHFVIQEKFLLSLPKGIPQEAAGPILCAGVTTYSPLKHWNVGPGMKVGIIGFGGLGHMATQIAKAMGAEITVITTTPEKTDDAKRLGASRVVVSTEKDQMKEAAKSLDLILDTIPEKHKIDDYLDLLHRDGVMVIVGVLAPEPGWNPQKVLMHRRTLSGSLIGSIAETREVLEFCEKHKVFPQVEVIHIDQINEAFQNVEKKKARYRYVIDLASLKKEDATGADKIDSVTHILQKDKEVIKPEPPVHAGPDRKNLRPGWAVKSKDH